MKRIRIGVMGCASIAKRMVIPAIKNTPELELIAVASRDATKAHSYAHEFSCEAITGYENLINRDDIDAVYMPLPTGLHLEWGHRVLDAGKHLLLEKSFASNFLEAESLTRKAIENQLIVKENYMFAYHSQQATVRELIQIHAGEVRLLRASFGFPPLAPDNFRYDKQLGGGALLDAGGYVLKALEVFLPGFDAQVKAATLHYNSRDVDLWGSAMLEATAEQQIIPVHVSFGFDNFYQCGIEVWGSRAKISTDRTFTAGPQISPAVRIESKEGVMQITMQPDNQFQRLLSSFCDAVFLKSYHQEAEAILKQARLQQQVRDIK